MEQYISKDRIVAEIERRKQNLLDHIICESDKEWAARTAHQLNRIILFLDTLEVKEVKSEKSEVKKLIFENNICGSEAENVNDLVVELKCDNLQLKAELRALQKKCDDLERNK